MVYPEKSQGRRYLRTLTLVTFSKIEKLLENIFIFTAPIVLISRVFLNYHTPMQILAGSTIGALVASVYFFSIGRLIAEGRDTNTFLDKIIYKNKLQELTPLKFVSEVVKNK